MPDMLTTVFVLAGPLDGKTIELGSQKFSFVDGKMQFIGTELDTNRIAVFLMRNWQAFKEEDVPKKVEPKKSASKVGENL